MTNSFCFHGLQYASGAYVQLLQHHYMIPSMSRPANPYENASCESFPEDAETRGDLREPISGSRAPAQEH